MSLALVDPHVHLQIFNGSTAQGRIVVEQALEAGHRCLYPVGKDKCVLVMIAYKHLSQSNFPAVGDANPTNINVNIVGLLEGSCDFSGNKSLYRRNGKYDQ